MPEEENIETEGTQEEITIPEGQTADEFLDGVLNKPKETDGSETEEPVSTEEGVTEAETTEGESETQETTEESGEEETEKFSEAEVLKQAGFTQTSFEDVKRDLDTSASRTEIYNWAAKNIPGFREWVLSQMEKKRGLDAGGPSEPPGILDEHSPDEIEKATKTLEGLGFESKRQRDAREAREGAVANIKEFGNARSKDVKEMGLEWAKYDTEGNVTGGVLADMFNIIEGELGITDPKRITPKLLARAWNEVLMDTEGGMERLIANAKTAALQRQGEKKKLRQIPKTGVKKPSIPANLREKFEKMTPKQMEEAMAEYAQGMM
jgi:hypothetical protein